MRRGPTITATAPARIGAATGTAAGVAGAAGKEALRTVAPALIFGPRFQIELLRHCARFPIVHDRRNNLWRTAMRARILSVGRLAMLFASVLSGSALAQTCGPSRINFSMYLASKPQD